MSRRSISILALIILLGLNTFLVPLAFADSPPPSAATPATLAQDEPTEDMETEAPGDESGAASDSLFEELSAILATLGVYVVTMFTMAIGTEILVDILKGVLGKPLGLKSRPATRDTLLEYEMFMSGKLNDLGLSAEAKLCLEKQISDLKKVLEPAFTAETVTNHLRQKEFSEALAAVGLENVGDAFIEQAKTVAKSELQNVVDQIDTRTSLGQAVQVALAKGDLQANIDKAIDRLARQAKNVTPEDVYQTTAVLVSGEIADGVTAWTRAYLNSLHEESYETAVSVYQNQLKPQIVSLSLGPKLEKQIDDQFGQFLENLKMYHKTDVYLESINQLLVAIEEQRNAARSTLGKLWESVVDWFKGVLRRSPLQHPLLTPVKYDPRIADSSKAASKLLDMEQYDKEAEKKRIRRLRFVSVVLGVLLAYLLQIDSSDLLRDLFPADANFLYINLLSADSGFLSWLGNSFNITTYDLTAGIILTGLAASAGSTFWHDQLSRLQAVKQGVQQAEEALKPILINLQNDQTSTGNQNRQNGNA